jgi:hypothetical protein
MCVCNVVLLLYVSMEKPVLFVTGLSQRTLFKRTGGHIALTYLVYCTKGI